MRAHVIAFALAFSALASACSDNPSTGRGGSDAADEGTQISIDIEDEDGKVAIKSDEDNRVNLKLPFGDVDVKIPKIDIDAGDIDIDGVDMYPGTKIKTFNINASNQRAENDADTDKAVVKVGMTYPAAAKTVADWYAAKLDDTDGVVTRQGNTLTGTSADGDRYVLAIAGSGNASTGDLVLRESK